MSPVVGAVGLVAPYEMFLRKPLVPPLIEIVVVPVAPAVRDGAPYPPNNGESTPIVNQALPLVFKYALPSSSTPPEDNDDAPIVHPPTLPDVDVIAPAGVTLNGALPNVELPR